MKARPTLPPLRPLVRRAVCSAAFGLGRALERASRPCFHVAAGALGRAELDALIEREWTRFGATRPTEPALMPWEEELYTRYLGEGERVLIVGCGTGRDLLALAARGIRVEGLDPIASCVEAAGREAAARGLAIPLQVSTIQGASLQGRYQAIVFSWFCYKYIPERAARLAALTKVRAHLATGGRLILSLSRSVALPRRSSFRLTRLVARVVGGDWQPELGDMVLPDPGSRGFTHYEHAFFPGEAEAEVRAAGFELIHQALIDDQLIVLVAEPRP